MSYLHTYMSLSSAYITSYVYPDVSTLWNSSFYMLQRLIEQTTALLASGAACASMIELRTQQWNLLQPFEEATREVSDHSFYAALVIPIVNSLQRSLSITAESTTNDHGITSIKRKMLASLSIDDTTTWRQINSMHWLQPLTHDSSCAFASASACASVRQMLMEEYKQLAETEHSLSLPEKQPRTDTESGHI